MFSFLLYTSLLRGSTTHTELGFSHQYIHQENAPFPETCRDNLMETFSQLGRPLPGVSHLYLVDKKLTRTSFFLTYFPFSYLLVIETKEPQTPHFLNKPMPAIPADGPNTHWCILLTTVGYSISILPRT